MTECERFKDLNFFDVGICKIKFEREISLFDKPEFSGPNKKPNLKFFLFSPILPLFFDLFLMPFHGFMGRCIGDNLSNFMTQYEATRTLSETVMESIPQLCLQVYMVIYCRMNGCNFQAEEGGDAALMQALVISISSMPYMLPSLGAFHVLIMSFLRVLM